MSKFLASHGITASAEGLVKAQALFMERAEALSSALETARGKVSEVVSSLRDALTDTDAKRAESVTEAFYAAVEGLEGEDRAKFFLAVGPVLDRLADYAEGEAEEYAASTLNDSATEVLANAGTLYAEAKELKDFANTAFALFSQLGAVPSELKVTDRKVRGGNEATVLDWPRITDPAGVTVSTGKRTYTTNLPVWTVAGKELPHGTTARTVAVSHVSTKENPVNAGALLSTIESTVGKDYRQVGGSVIVNDVLVSFTEWREVTGK